MYLTKQGLDCMHLVSELENIRLSEECYQYEDGDQHQDDHNRNSDEKIASGWRFLQLLHFPGAGSGRGIRFNSPCTIAKDSIAVAILSIGSTRKLVLSTSQPRPDRFGAGRR